MNNKLYFSVTTEYYSTIKMNSIDIQQNMNTSQKQHAERKKPNRKENFLSDCIYMKV